TFNQRDMSVLQSRSSGFVTHTYARAPGDLVEQNAPIADLLIPEWIGAQTEFIALLNSGDEGLIAASRQRLAPLGMPDHMIGALERNRRPSVSVTVRSPIAGVIDTLEVRPGMTLSSGSTLAKIDGLATIWLEAAIPESRAASVSTGNTVTVHVTG